MSFLRDLCIVIMEFFDRVLSGWSVIMIYDLFIVDCISLYC